jgi:ferredoxin-NADP reductase
MNEFVLGVSLDDNSRGGSRYLHDELRIGHTIIMTPGYQPKAVEDDEVCVAERCADKYTAIIGGIGVTAFLPLIKLWQETNAPFEIHYAIRSPEEAAFLDILPQENTTIYAKSRNERLKMYDIIDSPSADGKFRTRIFCCGPSRLMEACRQTTRELGYPDHMLHFEDFGGNTGASLGEPFEVEVREEDTGRKELLEVPSDKSLLHTLKSAGFDVVSGCQAGGCGTCKVTLCAGSVEHRGDALREKEKAANMLSCVDRGKGRIQIELD